MPDAKPVRLQRKRTKGFKMESPNGLEIVYVGRPSRWGNQFAIRIYGLDGSIRRFKSAALVMKHAYPEAFEEWIAPLRGKNLCCWCAIGSPCHADVLLELANKDCD